MPELRHDPIQKRWVIIASERGLRPSDFTIENPVERLSFCPFCEGHESKTPPEIMSVGRNGSPPNTPGWQVRVVSNKFPALKIEGGLERRGVGQYDRLNGIGAHEVIIETTDHFMNMADMTPEQIKMVLFAYRERLKDLMRDDRFRYVLIFKNHGMVAGASMSHPHSQIIATPVTPRILAIELESARNHYNLKERCIFCDIIAQEIESRDRIVVMDEHYISICPYASRFPFETMMLPRTHQHDFTLLSDTELYHLAHHFKEVLSRMKKALHNPPYNFLLHTAPNTMGRRPRRPTYWTTLEADWHWHFEILPRLTNQAGFEWGTGFYINPTPPEDAARYLRKVRIL